MRMQSTNSGKMIFGDGDPVATYLKDIKHTGKLSLEVENALAKRIRQGDKRALQTLVQANLKFVVSVCRNYQNQGLPMADLISEGNLGMMRAALRFDETQGIRFISYAVWWIRQGILEALSRQSRTVSLPSAYSMSIHKINQATRHLSQKLGRSPSVEELELETGMIASRIRECIDLREAPLSLNYLVDSETGTEFQDSLADHNTTSGEEKVALAQQKKILDSMLDKMSKRENKVLSQYFGLKTGVPSTLGEIADGLGLSRERVRQIKKRGLAILKRHLNHVDAYAY